SNHVLKITTMKVLIGCEESQEVCKAFRALGHEAYSCDLLDCSGGHPEWHLKMDVLHAIYWHPKGFLQISDNLYWDMIIAFPPCTYLSKAGAFRLYPKAGIINNDRFEKGLKAKEFFMSILNSK